MGIIETLGSRRRVATALTALLGEDGIRALAEQHRIDLPGFRVGRGPAPLIARRIAAGCATDRKLRRAVDTRLDRLAAQNTGGEGAKPLSKLASFAESDARAALAAALADSREEVWREAVGIVDAIESGELRLAAARPRPAPIASGPAPGPPSVSQDRERRPPPRERDDALQSLRRESARQESVVARLREQLGKERTSHAETRRKLAALRAAPGGKPHDQRALEEVRARLTRRESEILELRTALEAARNDLGVVIDGARALEHLTASSPAAGGSGEITRPTRPRKVSETVSERKVRTPRGEFWPDRLDALLHRLTDDPAIDAVHVIGASSGRASRVIRDAAMGAFIAQHSDGEHAAQMLIVTTADSAATHAWMRRHLATEYFAGR